MLINKNHFFGTFLCNTQTYKLTNKQTHKQTDVKACLQSCIWQLKRVYDALRWQISGENTVFITCYKQFSRFRFILVHFRAIWGINNAINGLKLKNCGTLTPPSSLPLQKLYPYQIPGENMTLIRSYNQFSGFGVIFGHSDAILWVNDVISGPKIKQNWRTDGAIVLASTKIIYIPNFRWK